MASTKARLLKHDLLGVLQRPLTLILLQKYRKHYLINSKQVQVRSFLSSNSVLVPLDVLFRTHKTHGIT